MRESLVVTTLLVDAANVVGSRPDGWWRDRAGATGRLLARLATVVGRELPLADGAPVCCTAVVVVVEGQARDVPAPPGVELVRAPGSGDDALVAAASRLGPDVVAVTADRGLRDRLPEGVGVARPGRLLAALDALGA